MGKIILLFVFCSISVFAKPYELLSNGSFEKIKDGKPLGWSNLTKRGHLKITENAQKGKYAVSLQSDNKPGIDLVLYTGVSHAGIGGYPVIPGAKYKIIVMARGKGKFLFYLNFSRASGGHIKSAFLRDSTYNLRHEWTQYSKDIVIPKNIGVGKISLGLSLCKNTDMIVDNVSLSFDPANNPNVKNIYDSPKYIRSVPLKLTTSNSTVEVYLNGKKVPSVNNQYNLKITEGLNIVGMLVRRTRANASLGINFPEFQEINSRWRTTSKYNPKWLTPDFDDSNWNVVKTKTAKINLTDDVSYFRQIILWNKTHYGQNRLIVPPVKVYNIPAGGLENFRVSLYSPLNKKLNDFKLKVKLPLGFRILNLETLSKGVKFNVKPSSVNHCLSSDKKYNIYTLEYDKEFLSPNKTFYTFVPVKMEITPEKKSISFKYYRSANGNFTELEQTIPIKILPPINGRILKKIKIQQYRPPLAKKLSREHVREYVKEAVKAGCNSIIISPEKPFDLLLCKEYLKNNPQTNIFLWFRGSFPMRLLLSEDASVYVKKIIDWMNANPDAKPRYYNDKPKFLWTFGNHGVYYGVLCPSYITSSGKAAYQKILREVLDKEFRKFPQSKGFFIDWEETPWRKSQMGLWCFCDRCKAAFRAKYKIPPKQTLTDKIIRNKYHKQWDEFRAELDGKMIKVIHEVCAGMGKKNQVYQWEGDIKFWKACGNAVDVLFTTVPGSSPADSNRQPYIDESFKKLQKIMGIDSLIGQRFPILNIGRNKDSWKNIQACSEDGFALQQKEWKSELLRIIAGVHGGLDIQNAIQLPSGALYYIGEATRTIAKYEDLFFKGRRNDGLAESKELKYPNLLVLQKGNERLILAFNAGIKPLEAVIFNKHLKNGQKAEIFEKEGKLDPTKISLTIPPQDVAVIHIK